MFTAVRALLAKDGADYSKHAGGDFLFSEGVY